LNEDQIYLIAALSHTKDEESVFALASKVAKFSGYEKLLIGLETKIPSHKPSVYVASDYPDQWRLKYVQKNYVEIDSTVTHCREKTTPLIWEPTAFNGGNQDFIDEAWSYNIRYGISIGIHQSKDIKSMCSFVRDKPINHSTKEFQYMLAMSQLLAQCIHSALVRIITPKLLNQANPKLSPRELQCIGYVAEGKSTSVISDILEIKEPTVAFHIKNALRKMNVSTRLQAVAQAVRLGIVE